MILFSHMDQSRLGTSQFVCATSQMSQSFLSTNQAILLLTKTRKKLSENYSRSFVSTSQATLLLVTTRKK